MVWKKMLIQKARNLHKKDSINKQEMLQIFLDMLQQMIRNPRQCLLQIWLINRVPDLQQKSQKNKIQGGLKMSAFETASMTAGLGIPDNAANKIRSAMNKTKGCNIEELSFHLVNEHLNLRN